MDRILYPEFTNHGIVGIGDTLDEAEQIAEEAASAVQAQSDIAYIGTKASLRRELHT
jgi:ribulose-5-phosphate 4-epimerase/fuculose-1-phosphate aldolase